LNPFFTNVVLKRLRTAKDPNQPASSTPRWATVVTWVIAIVVVAVVAWLVTELMRGQVP